MSKYTDEQWAEFGRQAIASEVLKHEERKRSYRHHFKREHITEPENVTLTDIAVAQDAAAQMDEQIKTKEQEWFIAHRTSVHPSLHQYIIREAGVIKKTGTKWVRLRLDEHILGVMTFRKEDVRVLIRPEHLFDQAVCLIQ